jgi:signal transduction histidine kinase
LSLGFDPQLMFEGPVDTLVPPALVDQVVAVLREALSNVARHAAATGVSVRIAVADGEVRVVVADDGKGIEPGGVGNGLTNLAARAGRLGGGFVACSGADGGTEIRWQAPIPTSAP